MRCPCYIHCNNTAASKACALSDRDVSGMFSLLEQLEDSGMTDTVRDFFVEALLEDIEVYEGAAPPTETPAMTWKHDLIELCLPSESSSYIHRKNVLLTVINGEIGERVLKHYGLSTGMRARARSIANALLPGRMWHFQRQRWISERHKIAACALLFSYAPHAIVKAIQSYCSKKDKSSKAALAGTVVQADGATAGLADQNQQARMDLMEWSRTFSGPRLVQLVLGMGVACRQTQRQLRIADTSFRESLFQRAFRVDGLPFVQAALGKYSEKVLLDLHDTFFSESYWRALPSSARTEDSLTKAYAQTARYGGGVRFC